MRGLLVILLALAVLLAGCAQFNNALPNPQKEPTRFVLDATGVIVGIFVPPVLLAPAADVLLHAAMKPKPAAEPEKAPEPATK